MSAPHNLVDGAVLSSGSATVLRPFFDRLDAGRPITLLALGSSITTNRGGCTHMIGEGLELERRGCCGTTCHGEDGWLRTWFDAVNATWPHAGHRLYNAGTAASTPLLFTECAEALYPPAVHLVVLDFVTAAADVGLLVSHLRSVFANVPILFANFFRWELLRRGGAAVAPGGASHGDVDLDPFAAQASLAATAAANGLPVVSLLHGLQAGGWGREDGSSLAQDLALPEPPCETGAAEARCWCPLCLTPDGTHPGALGFQFMGEALALLTHRAAERHRTVYGAGRAHGADRAPPPPPPAGWHRAAACYSFDARRANPQADSFREMLRSSTTADGGQPLLCPEPKLGCPSGGGKLEVARAKVAIGTIPGGRFAGRSLDGTLIEPWRLLRRDGWQYVLESPRPLFYKMGNVNDVRAAVKPGLVARAAHAELLVNLAAAGAAARRARGSGGGGAAYNYVGVDYLTSFERMGRARLRCAEVPGGCTCTPRTLDAHTREHASVRRVAYLKLGGAGLANCAVELTTLDRSSSGGFKWKLVRLSVGLALE